MALTRLGAAVFTLLIAALAVAIAVRMFLIVSGV